MNYVAKIDEAKEILNEVREYLNTHHLVSHPEAVGYAAIVENQDELGILVPKRFSVRCKGICIIFVDEDN